MSLIFLTRILLIVYAAACLIMLVRFFGLLTAGVGRGMADIGAILIFPLLLLTEPGRTRLKKVLLIGEK